MRSNRSIPPSQVTPELAYTDDVDPRDWGGTLASEADAS